MASDFQENTAKYFEKLAEDIRSGALEMEEVRTSPIYYPGIEEFRPGSIFDKLGMEPQVIGMEYYFKMRVFPQDWEVLIKG